MGSICGKENMVKISWHCHFNAALFFVHTEEYLNNPTNSKSVKRVSTNYGVVLTSEKELNEFTLIAILYIVLFINKQVVFPACVI